MGQLFPVLAFHTFATLHFREKVKVTVVKWTHSVVKGRTLTQTLQFQSDTLISVLHPNTLHSFICDLLVLSVVHQCICHRLEHLPLLIQVHLGLPQHVHQDRVTHLIQHHLLSQLRTQSAHNTVDTAICKQKYIKKCRDTLKIGEMNNVVPKLFFFLNTINNFRSCIHASCFLSNTCVLIRLKHLLQQSECGC